MEDLETYLASDAFFLFQDQKLREHACMAVESFLDKFDPVANHQLHSIPATIQAGGYEKLKELVKNQRDNHAKDEKEEKRNKIFLFWNFIFEHVFSTSPGKDSFQAVLKEELEKQGYVKAEDAEDKKVRNQIKKENKAVVNRVTEQVLSVYFQHFNCHYFYKTKQR